MKTKLIVLVGILCILLVAVSVAPYYETYECTDKLVYELFDGMFTGPFEIIYFVMNDMRMYKITSDEEHKVSIGIGTVKEKFKDDGYDFSDVLIVIHNHQFRYFSFSDARTFGALRREGFTGNFYIYVVRTKKIYELREQE